MRPQEKMLKDNRNIETDLPGGHTGAIRFGYRRTEKRYPAGLNPIQHRYAPQQRSLSTTTGPLQQKVVTASQTEVHMLKQHGTLVEYPRYIIQPENFFHQPLTAARFRRIEMYPESSARACSAAQQ
jgi:hypothetical protein